MGPFCHLEIQSAAWAPISKTPLKLVGRGITSIRRVLAWSSCPLSGVKRRWWLHCEMSALTQSGLPLCRSARWP